MGLDLMMLMMMVRRESLTKSNHILFFVISRVKGKHPERKKKEYCFLEDDVLCIILLALLL